MIEMLSGTLRERGRCFRRLARERERLGERERLILELTLVNPFFSNEKPGRRSQTEHSERRLWKINFQKSRTSQRLESLFYSGILSGQRCGVSIQHLF